MNMHVPLSQVVGDGERLAELRAQHARMRDRLRARPEATTAAAYIEGLELQRDIRVVEDEISTMAGEI